MNLVLSRLFGEHTDPDQWHTGPRNACHCATRTLPHATPNRSTGGHWGVRPGSEAAASSDRGGIEDWFLRACVVCVCRRVPTLQTRTGARRCSGADFCVFAAAVCLQMLCCTIDPTQKLPPAATEVAAKSFACLRAVVVRTVACHRFQTVLV